MPSRQVEEADATTAPATSDFNEGIQQEIDRKWERQRQQTSVANANHHRGKEAEINAREKSNVDEDYIHSDTMEQAVSGFLKLDLPQNAGFPPHNNLRIHDLLPILRSKSAKGNSISEENLDSIELMEKKADLESGKEISLSSLPPVVIEDHSSNSGRSGTVFHANLGIIRIFKRMSRSFYLVLFKSKLNLLLPFGPLAITIYYFTGRHGWVFFLGLLGIIPLTERLEYLTKQLAFYIGPTGGLLEFSVGNITEMIFSIIAIKRGMIRLAQLSLLGSILVNMLLVLGCALSAGGFTCRHRLQAFNKSITQVNSGFLLVSIIWILIPALLHFTHTEIHFGKSELLFSQYSSCVMLLVYGVLLFFQIKGQQMPAYQLILEDIHNNQEDTDEEHAPEFSLWEVVICLGLFTGWIYTLIKYIVGAFEGGANTWNIPASFVSVILLPVTGNIVLSANPIMFAMKDKLDITLGITIGSCTQTMMFVIPVCVIAGWVMGQPMDINFQIFEMAILFFSTLVVIFLLQDGTSSYFKGLLLIFFYALVALSFFVHQDPYPA